MRSLSDKLQGMVSASLRLSIARLFSESELSGDDISLSVMAGDGSGRTFLRVLGKERSIIFVLPDGSIEKGIDEARSAWLIGRHLYNHGVPVPALYGFDQETGVLLCEDLGNTLLHHQVVDGLWSEDKILSVYMDAIDLLIHMQVDGARGFSTEWCWDTSKYDRQLMLTRESGYFIEACCRKLLGIDTVAAELEKEFVILADLAGSLPADYFLHRDFQSRNLMVKGNRLHVLDFQGGRMGPLGYDLASLLIDPYVSLSDKIINKLTRKYQEIAVDLTGMDMSGFGEDLYWLLLQRNLQILGAFAFLYKDKGKVFFRDYLRPAAASLIKFLDEPAGRRFPSLRSIANELPERLVEAL